LNKPLSSRARLLTALECREPDYVPCCFSAFSILSQRCADRREFVGRQLDMGLDAVVAVSTPPPRTDPAVRVHEWREDAGAGPYPLLHTEYRTPDGVLETMVRETEDWPWGVHIPLFDDHAISRASKHLVTAGDSLDALRHLLGPPGKKDLARLKEDCAAAKALAAEHDLLTIAYYGMVGDVACWLAGIEPFVMLTMDSPQFVHEFLSVIEGWNDAVMDAVLRQGVDLFVRRAWYENADTWTPSAYREFILPGLRRDVERAHRAGAKFGYLMSCSSMPLLDMIVDAGVDVLLGIDPAQDRTMDLTELKRKAAGRLCLWGGVCGYLTMERGTPDEIREQVRDAISVLAPGGGCILAPVTNVREDNEHVWRNLHAMIDSWRQER
jgi:uroporphyrinogen decarboxylase